MQHPVFSGLTSLTSEAAQVGVEAEDCQEDPQQLGSMPRSWPTSPSELLSPTSPPHSGLHLAFERVSYGFSSWHLDNSPESSFMLNTHFVIAAMSVAVWAPCLDSAHPGGLEVTLRSCYRSYHILTASRVQNVRVGERWAAAYSTDRK